MPDFKPWREQHRTAREYNVHSIVGERIHLGRREFLVKWEGFDERTWEYAASLRNNVAVSRWLQLEPTSSLPVNEEQLQQLIDLGFGRDDAIAALRSELDDVGRAANRLADAATSADGHNGSSQNAAVSTVSTVSNMSGGNDRCSGCSSSNGGSSSSNIAASSSSDPPVLEDWGQAPWPDELDHPTATAVETDEEEEVLVLIDEHDERDDDPTTRQRRSKAPRVCTGSKSAQPHSTLVSTAAHLCASASASSSTDAAVVVNAGAATSTPSAASALAGTSSAAVPFAASGSAVDVTDVTTHALDHETAVVCPVCDKSMRYAELDSHMDACLGTKSQSSADAAVGPRVLDPAQRCVICLDAAKTHLIHPCGHKCICEGCVTSVRRELRKCPVCRRYVLHIIRVFE